MKIQEHISLAPYATLGVGGEARYFAAVSSEADLAAALSFARERKLSVSVIGGGSNLLIGDAGVPGLVIQMRIVGLEVLSPDARMPGRVRIAAGAGEPWDAFVADTVRRGLGGLENLSGIPGTVGASPVQNIGAYGVEAKDRIESVRAMSMDTSEAREFSNAECRFGYRDSYFKTEEGKRWVIASVIFSLTPTGSAEYAPNISYKDLAQHFAGVASGTASSERGYANPAHDLHLRYPLSRGPASIPRPAAPSEGATIASVRDAVLAIRAGKFPDLSQVGTAGSFWKNPIISRADFESLSKRYPGIPSFPAAPAASADAGGVVGEMVKVPLAWILDKVCNLKGYREGKVSLYEKQPLVLVAERGATAGEIQAFSTKVADIVREKTGISIEPEVVSF